MIRPAAVHRYDDDEAGDLQGGRVEYSMVAAMKVRLTSHGGELLGSAMRAMHPDATVAFAGLSDARLAALVELLAEVRVRLDDARSQER
ncbi:hypothetical protein [Actinoplanes sp. HUAS TT8]|uniref:hypothetical protein n=1 Tax=Actinoplanes sp. HUAS TT8 TaxID=3447453 RepID=UPI003F5282C5